MANNLTFRDINVGDRFIHLPPLVKGNGIVISARSEWMVVVKEMRFTFESDTICIELKGDGAGATLGDILTIRSIKQFNETMERIE